MTTYPKLKTIDYVDRDFQTILQSMIDQIPNVTDRWTDFNSSDVGISILELLSFALEGLHFQMDRQANEAFLETARERKNVINLCKLIAYKLTGVTSSSTQLEFSLSSPHFARIDIPRFTRCITAGSGLVQFATMETAVIPIGETAVLVGAREGVPKTDSFASDGTASQRFRLSEVLVDTVSLQVVIDNVIWTQVDSFVNAESGDKVYVIETDILGNMDVILGDGFFGYFPPPSTINNVEISYLVSSGSEGNIGSGMVKAILDNLVDVIGNPVSLTVTNIQSATGGDDQETIEHAKRQAPAELSALFRAMTKADFIALSDGYPGIGKSNAWGEQENNPPDYNLFNWVLVVAAPEGVTRESLLDDEANGALSDELKTELLKYLYDRATITTRIKILQPVYRGVDIELNVYYRTGALSNTVKGDVETELLDYFDFEEVSFGQEIRKSNVFRIVDAVSGVDYVEIVKLKTDEETDLVNDAIILQHYDLPYLRSLVINMIKSTGQPPVPNVYPTPPAAQSPFD